MDKKIVAVLAGSHKQFVDYVRVHPAAEDTRLVHVDRVESTRGMTFDSIVKVGTWYERPDCDELEQYVIESMQPSQKPQ